MTTYPGTDTPIRLTTRLSIMRPMAETPIRPMTQTSIIRPVADMSNHPMMGTPLNLFNGGLATDPRFTLFYGKTYMELLIYVF